MKTGYVMNLRKITALTALISFTLEMLTSVILYIVPQGRVAYWSDWHLWGLSKTQWGDLHINLGVLFVAAICLHIYYNWPVIKAYLKDKAKSLKIFTQSFNVALAVCIIFSLGTFFKIPPFSTILTISTHFKDKAALKYGEPPYGHAELSTLKNFTKKVELDLKESLEKLNKAGLKGISPEHTLAEIAKLNGVTPKEIFDKINPVENDIAKKGLPKLAPSGVGKKTLQEMCLEYGLEFIEVQKFLADNGYTANTDSTIKTLGAESGHNPHDIYDLLHANFSETKN